MAATSKTFKTGLAAFKSAVAPNPIRFFERSQGRLFYAAYGM